jgi:endogenous inhibitor of DNA gyrase (YacG/DUF329 family)
MDRRVEVACPYCGELVPVDADLGGGASQRYVEDCSVCCRPMDLSVRVDEDGECTVVARRSDD